MKIAYLASRVTLPGSPARRPDAHEHDQTMDALAPPLASLGLILEAVSWDDPQADWAAYGAVVIGTTWDYWDRTAAFLSRLDEISARTRLFNPVALVRWNSHKGYLRDLEAAGARLIPTLWLDRATPDTVAGAFETLGTDRIVLKRQVGAGAVGQHRLARGDRIPDLPLPMMVQPYLDAIEAEGEISLVFIDGDLSHGLVKRPAKGDYRIQSSYGGVETPYTPGADDLAAARLALSALAEPPLYARVDLLRDRDGTARLMELELIEPFLYPLQGPDLGPRFASALVRRLETE